MDLDKLKYPIGKFNPQQEPTAKNRAKWIKIIRKAPKRIKKATKTLTSAQLDTPYRPGGWTVRQVVHHLADSHINSYIRFKWALTEHVPMIKAYDEKLWAELSDAKHGGIGYSLRILSSVHDRWTVLLKEMTEAEFQRELGHPEWRNNLSLNTMLSLYAWHCQHHLAHITELAARENWAEIS